MFDETSSSTFSIIFQYAINVVKTKIYIVNELCDNICYGIG